MIAVSSFMVAGCSPFVVVVVLAVWLTGWSAEWLAGWLNGYCALSSLLMLSFFLALSFSFSLSRGFLSARRLFLFPSIPVFLLSSGLLNGG